MTLRPSLVLKLDISDVAVTLGGHIEHITAILSNYEIIREDDDEMSRSYLRMIGRGVELSFKADKLSTVFLYVTEGPEDCGSFSGETDLLTRDVLASKDAKVFCDALEAQGFVPSKKEYPFSVDRLNKELRLRREERQGNTVVLIDDGAMIR